MMGKNRFFYIVKTSFGGRGGNFGYAKTGKPRFNPDILYETITGVFNRLRRVNIEEGSFDAVIGRYDGKNTVFYLDPPYYETTGYRFPFGIGDYRLLASILTGIQGKFLLTINDSVDLILQL